MLVVDPWHWLDKDGYFLVNNPVLRHLVFYMFDRVSRNYTDLEMLEELVRDGEIVLHIASANVVLHRDSDDAAFFASDINIAQAKKRIGLADARPSTAWSRGA